MIYKISRTVYVLFSERSFSFDSVVLFAFRPAYTAHHGVLKIVDLFVWCLLTLKVLLLLSLILLLLLLFANRKEIHTHKLPLFIVKCDNQLLETDELLPLLCFTYKITENLRFGPLDL